MFMIGPKTSGKTTIGEQVAHRTNTKLINFRSFIKENQLKGKDDEEQVLCLINSFNYEEHPRVLIEDFPQNEFQAKFYMRNCKAPSNVFVLNCSKDFCQERMEALGKEHKNYINSGVLSQKIKEYNNEAKTLLPYLQKCANCFEVNSEQSMDKTLDDVYRQLEP